MRTAENGHGKKNKKRVKRKNRKVIHLPKGKEIPLPALPHVTLPEAKIVRKKARGWWENFRRLIRFRLVVPMQRHALAHPPEYVARGTAIGLAVAFTPLIGIQMYICIAIWLIARKFFKWNFSLLISCAWTWVTNFVTMAPTYYMFYITGQKILGRQAKGEYDGFVATVKLIFNEDMSTWEIAKALANILIKDWGVAMMVGCIPYAILFGYIGYKAGYKYAQKRRERLFKRYQPNA